MESDEAKARAVCIDALRAANLSRDTGEAHVDADDALLTYLRAIGRDDIADAFDVVPKRYA